jgi:Family of unknown function (DUF6496)
MARKYSKKASGKVERTMHEFKRGALRSGSGAKVTSREQAIAIGLAQARRRGYKVPPAPRRHHSSVKPRILKISHDKSFAGQRSIAAVVQYPGEEPARVEFVGPSGNMAGRVVMVTRSLGQTPVTDASRFGAFNKDWVRRFFA